MEHHDSLRAGTQEVVTMNDFTVWFNVQQGILGRLVARPWGICKTPSCLVAAFPLNHEQLCQLMKKKKNQPVQGEAQNL